MKLWKHDGPWTAQNVTTSDGYILTTFNIEANPDVLPQGPILIQHGNGNDATSEWFNPADSA